MDIIIDKIFSYLDLYDNINLYYMNKNVNNIIKLKYSNNMDMEEFRKTYYLLCNKLMNESIKSCDKCYISLYKNNKLCNRCINLYKYHENTNDRILLNRFLLIFKHYIKDNIYIGKPFNRDIINHMSLRLDSYIDENTMIFLYSIVNDVNIIVIKHHYIMLPNMVHGSYIKYY